MVKGAWMNGQKASWMNENWVKKRRQANSLHHKTKSLHCSIPPSPPSSSLNVWQKMFTQFNFYPLVICLDGVSQWISVDWKLNLIPLKGSALMRKGAEWYLTGMQIFFSNLSQWWSFLLFGFSHGIFIISLLVERGKSANPWVIKES